VSPTYFGAVADVEGLAQVCHARGLPLIVDEAWGAHFPFHADLPVPALSLGADLVVSSTHKVVGSVTQSAMVHLGEGDRIDAEVVDRCVTLLESTSPSSLLSGSLDAARRLAVTRGPELLSRTMAGLREIRAAVREVPGLDVLDERLVGAPGVHAYDPLRVVIDVRGTDCSGYELARRVRERHDLFLELAGENVIVAVFGMAEDVAASGGRLVAALGEELRSLPQPGGRIREAFAPPPPWGELVMIPREAFLGPQEIIPAVDSVGRVAAESLAAYPPGIPNVLPGERLTVETLDYVRRALEAGGSLRGASDRELRTIRAVVER
jgi:arginine decarboxylase